MRAEHNKVRTQLQAGRQKDRSSPYGTPGAKSPLSSPLIADAAALEALNLNPGSVKWVLQETLSDVHGMTLLLGCSFLESSICLIAEPHAGVTLGAAVATAKPKLLLLNKQDMLFCQLGHLVCTHVRLHTHLS